MAGAPVMITSNHQEKKYKLNGMVNGARGYIDSIQPLKDNPDEPDVVWVRFNDDKIGQLLRQDNLHLLRHHKPRDNLAVPMFKIKKQFKVDEVKYVRKQFPLTLCYAVTCHKASRKKFK